MAPVAALLLMHLPAEQAFWCLVSLCDKYIPGYYSPGMEAIQLDGDILFGLLRKVSPGAYRYVLYSTVQYVLTYCGSVFFDILITLCFTHFAFPHYFYSFIIYSLHFPILFFTRFYSTHFACPYYLCFLVCSLRFPSSWICLLRSVPQAPPEAGGRARDVHDGVVPVRLRPHPPLALRPQGLGHVHVRGGQGENGSDDEDEIRKKKQTNIVS